MIPTSPIDMAIDAGEFLEFAQLHGGQVVVTPLVALPIPRYDTDGVPAFEREAIPTEALWHPWFWIPTEMARRRDGETDDEWAMRIAIESSVVGFYDEDTASWLDILTLAGVDVGTNEGRRVVESWKGGSVCELTALPNVVDAAAYNEEDHDWGFTIAQSWARDCWVYAFHTQSRSLADYLTDERDADGSPASERFYESLSTVVTLAMIGVGSMFPSDDADWWKETRDSLLARDVSDIHAVADIAIEKLTKIADATVAEYEALVRAGLEALSDTEE